MEFIVAVSIRRVCSDGTIRSVLGIFGKATGPFGIRADQRRPSPAYRAFESAAR